MSLYSQWHNTEFTDVALVVGPNVRSTEEDFRDLQQYQPEVLNGYRVRLTTVEDHQRIHGFGPVSKIIVLDESTRNRAWKWMQWELRIILGNYPWCRIEYWYVHRAEGIWRVS